MRHRSASRPLLPGGHATTSCPRGARPSSPDTFRTQPCTCPNAGRTSGSSTGRPSSPRPSGALLTRGSLPLVHDLSADHSCVHLGVGDLVPLARVEDVAREDCKVRELADANRSPLLFLESSIRTAQRVSLHRLRGR